MSLTYHGKVPVTKDDIKMAKDHLKVTYKLNKQKIKDHKDALKTAQNSDNQKSATYNRSHLVGHQKDNAKIKTSMKTVNTIQPVKKSPGLTKFLTSKRVGAKAMSKIGAKKW